LAVTARIARFLMAIFKCVSDKATTQIQMLKPNCSLAGKSLIPMLKLNMSKFNFLQIDIKINN
jgi:hypothetical protein